MNFCKILSLAAFLQNEQMFEMDNCSTLCFVDNLTSRYKWINDVVIYDGYKITYVPFSSMVF